MTALESRTSRQLRLSQLPAPSFSHPSLSVRRRPLHCDSLDAETDPNSKDNLKRYFITVQLEPPWHPQTRCIFPTDGSI
jgi:hypothetical protein